jgi:hypothetical protein
MHRFKRLVRQKMHCTLFADEPLLDKTFLVFLRSLDDLDKISIVIVRQLLSAQLTLIHLHTALHFQAMQAVPACRNTAVRT